MTTVRGGAMILALILLIGAAVWFDIWRQRSLVMRMADAEAATFLNDSSNRAENNIHDDLLHHARTVTDVDTIGRTWTAVVEIQGGGSLVVTITGTRGFSFLPLFNTAASLSATTTSYIE
jgi:hypothetical protein